MDPHSLKLASERSIMKLTGLSRSQIRDGLRDFAKVVIQQKQSTPQPVLRRTEPEMHVVTNDQPRSITIQPNSGPASNGGIPAPPLVEVIVSGNLNGVFAFGTAAYFIEPS